MWDGIYSTRVVKEGIYSIRVLLKVICNSGTLLGRMSYARVFCGKYTVLGFLLEISNIFGSKYNLLKLLNSAQYSVPN